MKAESTIKKKLTELRKVRRSADKNRMRAIKTEAWDSADGYEEYIECLTHSIELLKWVIK